MKRILVLNGPNMNLLGSREQELYGNISLAEINDNLQTIASSQGFELTCEQSNAEHQLIEYIQRAANEDVRFIIINAAAFTHTSIALRDALLATAIPFIEVHLTNIFNREDYRSRSYLADIAVGVITGLGPVGYELALAAALSRLNR